MRLNPARRPQCSGTCWLAKALDGAWEQRVACKQLVVIEYARIGSIYGYGLPPLKSEDRFPPAKSC